MSTLDALTWPEPAATETRNVLRHIREFDGRPQPTWLVDGLIAEGQRVIIFGPPGVGKSFLAVDLAFSLVYRTNWLAGADWGAPTPPQRGVVILDNEALDDTLDRFNALEEYASVPDSARNVPLMIVDEPIDFAKDAADFGAALGRQGWGVLIIDLASNEVLKFGDDNSAADAAKFFEALKTMQRAYAANVTPGKTDVPNLVIPEQLTIIGFMHSNRAGDLRGSLAISGSVDLTLSIQPEAAGFKVGIGKARRIRRDWSRHVELRTIPGIREGEESAVCYLTDTPTRSADGGAVKLTGNKKTAFDAIAFSLVDGGRMPFGDAIKAVAAKLTQDPEKRDQRPNRAKQALDKLITDGVLACVNDELMMSDTAIDFENV